MDIELAPISTDDAERLYEWINDRELVLLSSAYSPVHEPNHEEWFEQIRSREDVVIFAIRLLDGGELVGSCQLRDIDPRHRTAELLIRIGPEEARGRGVGTQAVQLLLDHAFNDLDLARVHLKVFGGNERALRVYEKAGMRREGTLRKAVYLDGERVDVVVMAILRDEHLGRAS